ncbi:DUF397 domain-containing protein [Streptomyces sp. NPDC091272]|uniref:DUF397 domain-containing protein n=1 Tax=Streptomyces sp. NPDC091272 TaxID=3365981 RepID=UPI00380983EF
MINETLNWHKSSYSGGGDHDCVEIADNTPGLTHVRDTKLADASPVLTVADHAWNSFLTLVR